MTDPKPFPERRPPFSARPADPRQRPKTKQMDQSAAEWETFSALPPPAPKLGFPDQESETATRPTEQAAAVETGVKLATWKKRAGAFAFDFGLGLGASYVAQGIASLFGMGAEAVSFTGYTAFFAAWLVNRGYFQSLPRGQSFGKWLLNIKTIDTETDQSPSLIRSVAREGVTSLLVLTEALIVPLAADGLFAVFDKEKRQSIHDRAGRTQVVESDQGFHFDEKAIQFLEEIIEGDAADEVKSVAEDLLKQAKRNDTVADLSDQVGRMSKGVGRNTRDLRQQTGKQVKTWVDSAKKKMDNW